MTAALESQMGMKLTIDDDEPEKSDLSDENNTEAEKHLLFDVELLSHSPREIAFQFDFDKPEKVSNYYEDKIRVQLIQP